MYEPPMFDVSVEINALKAEIKRLRAAIAKIDAINDNPSHFNSEINAVCDTILRPELVHEQKADDQ